MLLKHGKAMDELRSRVKVHEEKEGSGISEFFWVWVDKANSVCEFV